MDPSVLVLLPFLVAIVYVIVQQHRSVKRQSVVQAKYDGALAAQKESNQDQKEIIALLRETNRLLQELISNTQGR